mmetsp:Transcript_30200/g.27528  ORF Transcript_30200/g.27528 Transcript_30200/m.27528 type:complete len:152 (+) Transcript_30200:685-1140(+)
MIGRAMKKIIKKEIAEIVVRESSPGKGDQKPRDQERINTEIANYVVGFLNIVFGSDRSSDVFWEEILTRQVLFDYKVDIHRITKADIPAGGLLHSIMYHSDITLNIDKNLINKCKLFSSPFEIEHFKGIKIATKTYALRTLEVSLLSDKYT